jgi:FtsP/CotA-like multicopper oxidase with cupredoxin domain
MDSWAFLPHRRHFVGLLGGAAFASALSGRGSAQAKPALILTARETALTLRPGMATTSAWTLSTTSSSLVSRFKKGTELDVSLENKLPVPVVLNCRGIDGADAAEPLLAQPPLQAGARSTFTLPLRHAGTFLADIRLLGDGAARASMPYVLIVEDTDPVAVDRDEILLVEDWRLRPDGSAQAPGGDPAGAETVYSFNRQSAFDLHLRSNERMRLRVVNGCQRSGIALKISDFDIRVMAIDGEPAEPFLARDGQLALAPGSRIDIFIDGDRPGSAASILMHDGIRPMRVGQITTASDAPLRAAALPALPTLPSNGLPARLDLQGALRNDLSLVSDGWLAPAKLSTASPPAFRVKRGRSVVLAVSNPSTSPMVFHLHGHHFRLLDKLDDGWKPYWLDTLAVDGGQTQRIAFAAEFTGSFLLQTASTDWAATNSVRWYRVDP